MRYLVAILLAALLAAGAATVYVTGGSLPAIVATHFDFGGRANGIMSRSTYLVFISLGMFGLPLLVAGLNSLLPRVAPQLTRIRDRDFWLAPERREETLAFIAASSCVLACLIGAFMIALHLLVVEANARTPPQLDNALLWTLIAVFVAATLIWQFLHKRRFRRPA